MSLYYMSLTLALNPTKAVASFYLLLYPQCLTCNRSSIIICQLNEQIEVQKVTLGPIEHEGKHGDQLTGRQLK